MASISAACCCSSVYCISAASSKVAIFCANSRCWNTWSAGIVFFSSNKPRRSLILVLSCLTGGQEAAGSSPVTRTIFPIKTADFQRFLSFFRTFLPLLFFVAVVRPRFDPYQQNFRERRVFLPALPVSISFFAAAPFQMAWAMKHPIRSAASLRISPVTWA